MTCLILIYYLLSNGKSHFSSAKTEMSGWIGLQTWTPAPQESHNSLFSRSLSCSPIKHQGWKCDLIFVFVSIFSFFHCNEFTIFLRSSLLNFFSSPLQSKATFISEFYIYKLARAFMSTDTFSSTQGHHK